MKKLVIKIVCFVILFFIVDKLCGVILSKYYLKFLPYSMADNINYAYTHQGDENLAIFGTSKASHHYIPEMFYDSLGLKTHNYGIDGHNIFSSYVLCQMVIEKSKRPEIVILDICERDICTTPTCNTDRVSAFNPLYGEHPAVDSIMNIREWYFKFSLKNVYLYRYNSKVYSIFHNIIIPPDSSFFQYDGYLPLYSENHPYLETKRPQYYELNCQKIEYVERFIRLCKTNNVNLVFAISPIYIKYSTQNNWVEVVENLSRKYKVSCLNYDNNELFLQHPEYFKDEMHLTDEGAKVYTSMIIRDLKSNNFKQ